MMSASGNKSGDFKKSGDLKPLDETTEYDQDLSGASDENPTIEEGEAHKSQGNNASSPSSSSNSFAVGTEIFMYVYSTGLLIFSVAIVMALIFSGQTLIAESSNPILAFVAFWFLLLWLAMMEGGQGCLVGLKGVDTLLYETTHPTSLKSTKIVHQGDNLEKFIVGRQFLVVLVVFGINLCGAAVADAEPVLHLPNILTQIFVGTGVAMILTTITLGQLTAQVNATDCMLDFINNYFMVFTTYASLAIEYSGLLHCVYLVQIIFSKLTGIPVEATGPPRTTVQTVLFWVRVLFSLFVLSYALAVTLAALFDGKTTMWEGVPSIISVILFFVLMGFVGMMEGMQIALFAVVNLPEEELSQYPTAFATTKLAFTGTNLQAFLIGRQICVTICMFIVARIATLNVTVGAGENVFGVSDGIQSFFNLGLLGAVITTVLGSLAWRIIASSFPVAFLSNPLVYMIIRLCLVLEASELCAAAWLLAVAQKKLMGYKVDDSYIGTPEERRASALAVEAAKLPQRGLQRNLEQPSMRNMTSYRSMSMVFDPSALASMASLDEDIQVEAGIGGSNKRPSMQRNLASFRSPSLKLIN